jgi:hypothetical protein
MTPTVLTYTNLPCARCEGITYVWGASMRRGKPGNSWNLRSGVKMSNTLFTHMTCCNCSLTQWWTASKGRRETVTPLRDHVVSSLKLMIRSGWTLLK